MTSNSYPGAVYVVALTFLAAAIVGIVPALKATGGRVQSRLQGLSAGSGGRMQMGSLWTLLIVAQVAFTVALLPATMYHAWNSLRFRTGNRGFGQEFLTAELSLDGTTAAQPIASSARSALYAARAGGARAAAGSRVRGQQRDLLDGRIPATSWRWCSRPRAWRRRSIPSTTTSSKAAGRAISFVSIGSRPTCSAPSTCPSFSAARFTLVTGAADAAWS